jgi:hypothetical protein
MLKLRSFPPNCAPKMRERHQLFFGLRLLSKEFQHPQSKPKYSSTLADFSSNKSAPANRKTGFNANVIRTSRRLDSFLHELVQNFEVFQIF